MVLNKRISNELSPSTKIPISSETYPYPETNNSTVTNDQQARKGSVESIASLQSYESQVSVESSESQHSHDNSSSKPIPSTRVRRGGASSSSGIEYQGSVQTNTTTSRLSSTSRRTDSSSTGFSDGETDAETPSAVHSAPPCFNASMASFSSPRDIKYHQTNVSLTHSPNSDIWRKRPDLNASEYPLQVPQKPSITRSPQVSQRHRNFSESLLDQERLRLDRLTNKAVLNASMAKLDSPTRREQRRASDIENTSTVIITNKRDQGYSKESMKDYSYLRRQNSEGDATLSENVSSVIAHNEKAEPDVPVSYSNT